MVRVRDAAWWASLLSAVALVLFVQAVPLPAGTPTPSRVAGAPPAAAAERRPGGALTVGDAIKELGLIRPPRLKRAEEFTLPTPEGGNLRLSEHRGKVVMINFWATWCPPCLEEMPVMERLYRQHREAGFVMVAVSVDSEPRAVPPFLADRRFTFSVGLDPKMELANRYGVRGLPSSFIVDRAGNLHAVAFGPRAWDSDASHALIEGLLAPGGESRR